MAGPFCPSGRQFLLDSGDLQLVVAEVGGGIRTYRYRGEDVLDGYDATETCSGGRGQLLAPWPNRVGDGRWGWEGVEYQLPLTEPEHSNAIHGLVRWLPWTPDGEGGGSSPLRMLCTLHPQPGWPWRLALSVTYSLDEPGLTVTTGIVNLGGPGPCPVGIGWHPYLSAFGGLVDDLELQVPANMSYLSDDRGLPVATEPVAGTDDDFRVSRRIGRAKLDLAFTEFDRDSLGRASIEVRPVAEGLSWDATRLWMDENYRFAMVYTGDTLAESSRRRRGVAIEPMTCAPDMLRNRDGMVVLPEGSSMEATWGLELLKF